MPDKIGYRLLQARRRLSLSQEAVAAAIGASVRSVRRWEQDQGLPQFVYREALCRTLQLDFEELFQTADPQESDEQKSVVALWYVPYARNLHFTGRDELLVQLEHYFSLERQDGLQTFHRAALTQPQAIKGLGGIGKTQVALEYAYRAREQGRYIHTFWVNAASEEAIMTSFVMLAELLPEFSARAEANQRKLVAAIKRWLEDCQQRWLLIFDNADEITLIQDYLPQAGNGSVLLTTRAGAVGALAASIEVEKMGLIEGTYLLLKRSQRFVNASDEEVNEAGNIVVALDHFPLALDQAGAYIEETRCSFTTYLQLYQDHRHALLAKRGIQVTHYPDAVAATWLLSFQKVEQTNPAAAELLRLCAFLAPDHIPEELLRAGASYWPPLLQSAAADLFTFNQLLENLLTFSLVKRLAEDRTLSLHRLVQVVQKDMLEPEVQRQWAERVVRVVNMAFPADPKESIATWPQCLKLLEQAQACDTLIRQYTILIPEAPDLLERVGIYLQEHALYEQARPLFKQGLCIREQIVPPERSEVVRMYYHLGTLARLQGKYAEAEMNLQKALHLGQQVAKVGDGQQLHALIMKIWTSLGNLFIDQGRYGEAEGLFLNAVSVQMQSVMSDQPVLAALLNGLGNACLFQGRYHEAEEAYQKALQIWEKSLGSEHPQIAHSFSNLAVVYYEEGKYEKAQQFALHALEIRERAFGHRHPQVANTLTILGGLALMRGKYRDAETLHGQALQIWEQIFGPEHLQLAYALVSLGKVYRVQGVYVKAEQVLQHALDLREQALGAEHAQLIFPLAALGGIYRDQGRYAEAEHCLQRVLKLGEQTLGAEHSDLIAPLIELGALQRERGDLQEAERLLQRAKQVCEQHFGKQHPKLTLLLSELGEVYRLQEKDLEAQQLYQQALDIWQQTQENTDHPDLIFPLNSLASIAHRQRKFDLARSLYEQAMNLGERHLESWNPGIAGTAVHLAELCEEEGRVEEAVALYQRACAIYERIYGPQHIKTNEVHERLHALLAILKAREEKGEQQNLQRDKRCN